MKKIGKFIVFLLFCAVITASGFFVLNISQKEQNRTKDFINVIGVVVDYREDFEPNNNNNDEEYDEDSYFDEDYVYAPIIEYIVDDKEYLIYSDEYVRTPPYLG